MSRISLLVLALAAILALGSGCVFGRYGADRANDFVDMFGLRVSGNLGLGLEANVRATELIQTGFGWSEKYVVGISGREAGVYLEQSYSLPFIPSDWFPWVYPVPFGFERGVKREILAGNWSEVDVNRQVSWVPPVFSDIGFTKRGKVSSYDRRWDDIGFSVFAGVVGVEAEVRLREVFDFVLGIFTIDFMKDDHLRTWLKEQKAKAPKRPVPKKIAKPRKTTATPKKRTTPKKTSRPPKPPAKKTTGKATPKKTP